ncbi:MAG: class I adenylate-forming enzyme family protein [Solirubrobacteraceae bacterium]
MTTMIGPLRRAVQVAPDAIAARCGEIEVTYSQTWERARRLAGALQGLGVSDGDRVAVVGRNCHRYLELYQAIPGAGMVLVPLNQRHTAAELGYALRDSGAKVLFVAGGVECPRDAAEHVIDLDDRYEALLAAAQPADFPDDLPPETIAGLFYTGGTTGASKGVILTHRNLIANAFHFQAQFAFRPHTTWLVAAPLFHAAGSIAVLATVWHGGCQVPLAQFDPGGALDLVEAEHVTATLVVPTMLAALADEQLERPRDVSSLRLVSHGGAPVATETLRRAHAAFPDAELMHLYGTTETAPIATIMPHEEDLLDAPQARSCGQPAIGVEVRVIDLETDAPAGPEVVGEVAIRGENVMAGYWNKPEATDAALADGWYRTGDLGYMDDRSFLYLVDRAKDMIVSGGENVYSTEVEEILYRHPAVLEAAVFGIPDPRWGEAVHAVVVPRGDVGADELLAHCRGAIADYKIPKQIELRAEPLPKSGAGKVLKRQLRAPYWTGHESVVGGA